MTEAPTLRRVVLVLSSEADRNRVREAFTEIAPEVALVQCACLAEARNELQQPADVVIADDHLADGEATDLLADPPEFPLVALVGRGQVVDALDALEEGAVDWAVKTDALLDALPHLARGALREWREYGRRRAAEDRLQHADRLATVGRIAAGVIHEVGTPLNVIRMQAQLLQMDPTDLPRATTLIVEQCDRIAQILRQTLDLSRARSVGREQVDLRVLAERALALLGPTLRHGQVTSELTGPSVEVQGDASTLVQVVLNLLTNALDAMPRGGRVELEVGQSEVLGWLSVRDHGTGIDSALLPSLFAPFVTTKEPGRGTGLGLHVSAEIAREHRGALRAENHPDGGARFLLELPK